MVCGGFACSKNCLCALNLLYTLVSLLLIGIAAWGIGFGLISSLRVVGVVIAVGIFLFLIALVGLIGAVKHHQVLLFFYMIILLLVFIVQFSVSCACLALNQEQQAQLLEVGWNNTASARDDIQRNLNCCGFRSFNPNDTCLASCVKSSHPCSPCAPIIGRYAGEVLRFVGGIGLFFSFTEVFLVAQLEKESACNAGDPSLIPGTEEPGGLQSVESQSQTQLSDLMLLRYTIHVKRFPHQFN
uniref:Tetraspanin 13 n=1 Tax=Bos taurus TaxID=9913 RepID=A0AAA9TLZ4_BOVIN